MPKGDIGHLIFKSLGLTYPELTFYSQDNGLAGLVLSVLVVDGLSIIPACIRGHGGEDHKSVVQGYGSKARVKEKTVVKKSRKHNKMQQLILKVKITFLQRIFDF